MQMTTYRKFTLLNHLIIIFAIHTHWFDMNVSSMSNNISFSIKVSMGLLMALRRQGRPDTLVGGGRHRLFPIRPYHVYIGLGSNLGCRAKNLKLAVEALNEVGVGIHLFDVSVLSPHLHNLPHPPLH